MTLSNTEFDSILKELYPVDAVEKAVYEDNILLGLLPKFTSFEGKRAILPIQYGRPQAVSNTFSTAQGNSSAPSQYTDWQITMSKLYGFAFVDNLTLRSSKTNKGAFVQALESEMDGIIDSVGRKLNFQLFGAGNSKIGQRASVSGAVITLSSPSDVVHFEIGMQFIASANADGSSARSGTGTVSAVDRDLGKVTYTGTITSFADNDYLFLAGSVGLSLSGLDAWLPSAAPSSTAFFGVDRSVDTTRLGGVRYDGSALSHREAIYNAITRVDREGGRPDVVIMNPLNFAAFQSDCESDSIFDKAKIGANGVKQEYGAYYDALTIHSPKGKLKVLADRDCPVNVGYALQLNTWKFMCINAPVIMSDEDGDLIQRQASADGVEIRVKSYSQLACSAPGKNARITLPSV